MPSVTVLVSSDTDIYISPGLYGDCLPTVPTGGASDSFRGRALDLGSFSCSHTHREPENGSFRVFPGMNGGSPGFTSHRRYGHRQSDVKRL
ncbi:hypothetical protein CEB94_11705 [Streptomyces hawaiiensis]|uniref:Uncharacterized protein n=1 Tax=Streptomyces hawaiiensis TaxID=67305 RepID=A0A6G5RBL4_9ACTN|nr:hypothetical protein CEB94_11705 [Streptomyces hawaiiensis]